MMNRELAETALERQSLEMDSNVLSFENHLYKCYKYYITDKIKVLESIGNLPLINKPCVIEIYSPINQMQE